MENETGYVYILTNPSFREDWVKIGKSSRPVDVRSKELDNTAVPLPFEIYATLKTTKYAKVERQIHKQIDRLTDLRIRQNREFFNIAPSVALDIMRDIADLLDDAELYVYVDGKPVVSKSKDEDKKIEAESKEKQRKTQKPPFKFHMIGLNVGDTIVLGEETFDIIGKDDINDPGEYEIPFTAFPKNCVWIRLNFGLAQLPTRAQYETFRDLLLSYGCKPAEFYVSNNADLRQEYSMLVVSALLAILAGVNMYMIYRFIFKKRRKKLAVFLLCGCSKKRARMLFFTEILCNMLCVVIVATGLFRFVVFPQMLTWFKYVDRIYGIKEYGTIIGIFLFVVLLIGYALSFSITRKSILDFKRGEL